MTLEKAVEVLVRERHRDYEHWQWTILGVGRVGVSGPPVEDDRGDWHRLVLSAFEAVAISMAYERISGRKPKE